MVYFITPARTLSMEGVLVFAGVRLRMNISINKKEKLGYYEVCWGSRECGRWGLRMPPVNAHEIGAKAFALFTRNQRQWKSQPLKADSIHLFKERCEAYGYDPGMYLAAR